MDYSNCVCSEFWVLLIMTEKLLSFIDSFIFLPHQNTMSGSAPVSDEDVSLNTCMFIVSNVYAQEVVSCSLFQSHEHISRNL